MDWFLSLGGLAGLASLISSLIVMFRVKEDLRTLQSERKKIEAESSKLISEKQDVEAAASERITSAAISLIEPLEVRVRCLEAQAMEKDKRIAQLESKVLALACELEQWQTGARTLTDQIVTLGHEPAWKPQRKSHGK